MRLLTLLFTLLLVSCSAAEHPHLNASSTSNALPLAWAAGLPVYDHIVFVVMENKDYDEIIGNPRAPYINNILKKEGANFTQIYGEEHFSQGNYFWMFSGSNQTIGFIDQVPSEKNNPDYPFTTANLGEQLITQLHEVVIITLPFWLDLLGLGHRIGPGNRPAEDGIRSRHHLGATGLDFFFLRCHVIYVCLH